jgi:hypothetical protein
MSDLQSSTHPFEACAECGVPFKPEQSYPAAAERDDDGSLQVHSFCDDDCLAAWQD